MFRSVVMDD